MPRVTARELRRALAKAGFEEQKGRGSSPIKLYNRETGAMVILTMHPGKVIAPGLLSKILKEEAKMTVEELRRLS